jgi:hypothetical protein
MTGGEKALMRTVIAESANGGGDRGSRAELKAGAVAHDG